MIQTQLDLSGNGAAYLRVSTDNQDSKRQYSTIEAVLRASGVTLPKPRWFIDEGWARDEAKRRPDFQRLLTLVEQGKVDWIMVDRQDRFGTVDADEFGYFRYILRQNSCRLLTADGEDLTGDEVIDLLKGILNADKSRGEVVEKSNRVLKGQYEKARKGLYLGGLPPFAFDVVCFESDQSEQELWRIVFEGKDRRAKVFPDGRIERYDGPNNRPKKEGEQVLRLRPSRDRSKLESAISVFEKYAKEVTSFNSLGKYLNALGYVAGGGTPFTGENIVDMLRNPAYIGKPAWNKRHVGKYHRLIEGRTVPTGKKKSKNGGSTCERNIEADWVCSDEPAYPPIVSLRTWGKVQQKLINRHVAPRAARSAEFVLSGLLICGQCGEPLVGGKRRSRNGETSLEYYCNSYHKWRATGQGKCLCSRHTTKQDTILGMLGSYLEDIQAQIIDARRGVVTVAKPLRAEHSAKFGNYLESWVKMSTYISERLAMGYKVEMAPLDADDIEAVKAVYREFFDRDAVAIRTKADNLRAELDELTTKVLTIPTNLKRAREQAIKQLEELEAGLNATDDSLTNHADHLETYDVMLSELETAIDEALEALRDEQQRAVNRELAAALRTVITSITVWHRAISPGEPLPTGVTRRGTLLERVSIASNAGRIEEIERGCFDSTSNHARNRGKG